MPIKHYGIDIGTVSVDQETGIVTFIMLKESLEFGRELAKFAVVGLVTGLNISPIMPPAIPKMSNGGNNFGPQKPITS